MNILFMGTPDFAQESLKVLYENNYNILGVVTKIDTPKGRGMKLAKSEVKIYAEEKGLKIFQPEKVKNNTEFINEIKSLNPDLIVVVAYGKILPKDILDIPKYGCINVHASLLPKYRGAAPIQWSVLNGDKVTGITTMYMDIGMDTGDIIMQEELEIGENETTGELWDRLKVLGGKLLLKTVQKIENNDGKVERIKQGDDFTIAPMLNKEMAVIDFNKTANEIHNLVRGLNPIMGAITFMDNKKYKIWKTEVVKENLEIENIDNKQIGEVLISDQKKGLFIKTNNGIIKVLEIQGDNGKRLNIGDFLRGNNIEVGKIFK